MTTTSKIMPLRVSPNGRYFLNRAGEAFFWLGDTQWHLFRSCSEEDVRAILSNRKSKGFSVIQVMLIGWEKDPQPNIAGELPWIDSDPAKPNERYFEHVDRMLRIACEMDFAIVLGVYHKTQERFYTEAKAQESARWIAARYRDVPQIIWSMYPEAKKTFIPIARAIAQGLREGDGGQHWITIHPDPSPQSSSFMHDEPWLAFNSLQTWNDIDLVYPMTAADYGRVPIKPVVMAEGGYEGATAQREITALDIRRQAYWTHLAGGHHVYGNDEHYKSPTKWRQWIDSPGSIHLNVYRSIVRSLTNWWDVVPDQSIIVRGISGGFELNAAAKSGAGEWAVVYFASECKAKIRMDRVKMSEVMTATWVDPVTAARTPAGEFKYADVVELATPKEWEDSVLMIEAK
jgi:Protein of unknown function (DUF4038)/Putative collagen-binding domain of a collagenase